MAESEEVQQAMRELWEGADAALRRAIDLGDVEDLSRPRVETPAGLEISKTAAGFLELSAEFTDEFEGETRETTVTVEYSPDIRVLPQVHIEWLTESDSGTNTPARSEFPKIAAQLGELVSPDWAPATSA